MQIDTPQQEHNHRILREVEIDNVFTQQIDYRYVQCDRLLFNIGYRFIVDPQDFDSTESSSWVVCVWSSVATIDLVLKDIINEGASLQFYARVEETEYYHVNLGTPRKRDWVVQKIFVPEQVVYCFPRMSVCSEFAIPIASAQALARLKIEMNNRMQEHLHHQRSPECKNPPPTPQQKSLDPDHPFE